MSVNGATAAMPDVTVDGVLAEDSYNWLELNMPKMIEAISCQLGQGKTPRDIKLMVNDSAGRDRPGLALRCYQAAMWLDGDFQ